MDTRQFVVLMVLWCGSIAACSDNNCKKACDKISSCLGPGQSLPCTLSAQCNEVERCVAGCINDAPCAAITGEDQTSAGVLNACQQACTGAGTFDGGPLHDGTTPPSAARAEGTRADGALPDMPIKPIPDEDQDGFTIEEGDCNDKDAKVNPLAFEVVGLRCQAAADCPSSACVSGFCRCAGAADCPGGFHCLAAPSGMAHPEQDVCRDNQDNDCDGQIDELPTSCDDPAGLTQNNPYDYLRAIDLCNDTATCSSTKKCPGGLTCRNTQCSRVLSASFNSDADGQSHTVASAFAQAGPIKPQQGQSMAILSTGIADYDPKTTCPQPGTNFYRAGVDPDPNAAEKEAFDVVELSFSLLVPINAQSFELDFQFLSAEYPEWINSAFNDTVWIHLESQHYSGNIVFDKTGRPLRINNALFDICDPDPSVPKTQLMCAKPASVLTGTGFAKECTEQTDSAGGSTGWLRTIVPVQPGETITLTASIFDKGDGILDSTVILDHFSWSTQTVSASVTIPLE